jgi:hypothetical protein
MRTPASISRFSQGEWVGMKTALSALALLCCLVAGQPVEAAQGGLIYAESGKLSPLVESVVKNFQGLLDGSTIIVVNTDGDEQRELAKVESFLANKKGVAEAPQIVESIRKQFRRDKTGFSHPIWLTDDSAQGNACVLAVRRNGQASYTSLVSKKIDTPLIAGNQVRPLDGEAIQASVVAHEMYHCYEYLRGSMTTFWEQALRTRLAYAMHRSESAADAYAALYVLQNYDALTTLRTQMEFRRIGMLNSDVEHNTSLTVEQVLKSFNRDQLAMMTPEELIRLAADIRDDNVMDEQTFVSLKKSSIEITGAYLSLLSRLPGLDLKKEKTQLLIETMMLMDDAPRDSRLTARVLDKISASLYKVGAGEAVSSKYFQPLVEQYAMKTNPRLSVAAYEARPF